VSPGPDPEPARGQPDRTTAGDGEPEVPDPESPGGRLARDEEPDGAPDDEVPEPNEPA